MNIFLCILLLLIIFFYLNEQNSKKIREGLDEDNEAEYDPDYDPMNSDYTQQIKSVSDLGFNSKGDFKGMKKNVKASKRILSGLFDKQSDVVKGDRAIGTKLLYSTGFKCKDSNDTEQDLYTYLDNSGSANDGLIKEVGNATANIFKKSGELFSATKGLVDDSCTELELKIITNSGNSETQKAFIQNSEIPNIDPSNIV